MVAFSRFCFTTKSRTPAASHAWTMAWPSDHRVAIGFSVTTWRPASAASMVCCACKPLGVARMTASASEPASNSVSEGKPGTPAALAARASDGASVSHTATSSALRPCRVIASMCFAAIRPHPTRAKRIFRFRIGPRGAGMGADGLRVIVS